MCGSLLFRKGSVVLQAYVDEQINQAVGHIDDILNRLFGGVTVGQGVELLYKFFFNLCVLKI